MAGSFGTTTEEMQRAGGHVQSVNQTVQGELSTLRSQLAPLAGMWRGAAATQFTQLMARWDTSAGQLNEALRTIGERIHGNASTYQQAEDEQLASMSSITRALG